MPKYTITLNHDEGQAILTTYATSKQAAIDAVCKAERCPTSAVQYIEGPADVKLQHARFTWSGAACTLNGQQAKVCGRLRQHAIIASLTSALAIEVSWAAVDRVMLKDRNFTA